MARRSTERRSGLRVTTVELVTKQMSPVAIRGLFVNAAALHSDELEHGAGWDEEDTWISGLVTLTMTGRGGCTDAAWSSGVARAAERVIVYALPPDRARAGCETAARGWSGVRTDHLSNGVWFGNPSCTVWCSHPQEVAILVSACECLIN